MTGNQTMVLLVDTGADISLCKINKIIPKQFINRKNAIKIKGVTDGLTFSLGTTQTEIYMQNYAIHHTFHVVDEDFPIPADGILGRDFIIKYQCQLNYRNWTMTLNMGSEYVELPIYNSPGEDTLIVPPRCEVVRKVTSLEYAKESLVILNKEVSPGVFIASAIVSNSSPFVKILNTTLESVIIKNTDIETDNLNNYAIYNIETKKGDREATLLQELNQEIPEIAKDETISLCKEFADIFALSFDKLSTNNFYKQKLKITDTNPVFIKNYRIPHAQKAEIKDQVNKMLENDIIEPSSAEYNSPILLVPKKTTKGKKSWRLCIDFRALNQSKLVADKFPLPRIDDILDQLGRAKWFSTLDLKSGFHQIPLEENSRDVTTFSTDTGSYRFTRLPFGLKVSPNSFQRMMSIAFAGITPEKAFLYMDDIIVIGCSKNHHLGNLRSVFETCRKFSLKLNPEKCTFFQQQVTYLGHKITSKGILPDDSKYEIINKYPTPTNADAVKRFIAFCNYYRRFIPHFAEISKPLNNLTRKKTEFDWSQNCQNSFDNLKAALMNPQILQYPDFNKQFILTTDASKQACGAVLSQNFEDQDLPIAFASRAFTKGEANKATIEQELAAIHWAINYFRPYLYGNKFLVKSDHKPLVYLFAMKNPSSKLTRMRLDLEEYDFEVEYIKGKDNVGADALSRIKIEELRDISSETAQILAITRSMSKNQHAMDTPKPEETKTVTPKVYGMLGNSNLLKIPILMFKFKPDYLRIKLGMKGHFSAEGKIWITNGGFSLEEILSKLERMAGDQNLKKIKIKSNDAIFQKCTINEFKEVGQKELRKLNIIIYEDPQVIKNDEDKINLMNKFHDDPSTGGHCGQKRLLKKLRVQYRWKGMSKDVARYVKKCMKCQVNKKKSTHVEPMVITPTPQKPFDIVCIDTIGPFAKSPRNNSYAVTIQCELTKYVKIIPVPNKEANTIAKAIMNEFILTYGPMQEIRTDMGTEYRNEVLTHLCKLLNVSQKFSTAYHSQTIGGCERNHRVFNEYTRMYINDSHTDWDEWIPYYSFCYNTTPSSYHNYTPFELIYARKAEIPEMLLGTKVDPVYNIDAFYQEVRYRLQVAHKRAKEYILKAKENRKRDYDKQAKQVQLQIADLVILNKENRSKFDAWYKGPFTVTSIDRVNCTIKDVNGKEVTVHKNRVQPFIKN